MSEPSPQKGRGALGDAGDYAATPIVAEELRQRLSDLAARLDVGDARQTGPLPCSRLVEAIGAMPSHTGCVAVATIRALEPADTGPSPDAQTLAAQVLCARFPRGSVRGQLEDGGLSLAILTQTPGEALEAVRRFVAELSDMPFQFEGGWRHLSFSAGVAWTMSPPDGGALLALADEVQRRAHQSGELALDAEISASGHSRQARDRATSRA